MTDSSEPNTLFIRMDELLQAVDHSSTSNTKYHKLEQYVANQVGIQPKSVYAASVSKAGNARVRFEQSSRARQADLLIALADSADDDSLHAAEDTLVRYQSIARPDAEILIMTPTDESWVPRAAIFTSKAAQPLVSPFIKDPVRIAIHSTRPESSNTPSGHPNAVKFLALEPGEKIDLKTKRPIAVLRRDQWDDFGYKTTFSLTLYLNEDSFVKIGDLKILQKGQETGYTHLPSASFKALGQNYCSLGQSYSFYEKINTLEEPLKTQILTSLRDIVFDSSIRDSFELEGGFSRSLVRTGSAARALEDAPALFKPARRVDPTALSFSFTTSTGGDSFSIRFTFNQSTQLPDRINTVIGYNGTGKTQLLANLALVAMGDLWQRQSDSQRYGIIDESESIRFSSVIAISYSAFDTFVMPNAVWRSPEESELATERLRTSGSVFGYTYCGLRNHLDAESDHANRGPRSLKSIDRITEEFELALDLARQRGKRPILRTALRALGTDPSFGRVGVDIESEIDEYAWHSRNRFESMSTGHKIVLNIIVQIVARGEPGSLILIDEPESHLHPSLLSALMKALGAVLEQYDSYAIVATHSPVVLQEIPRKYVRILKRFGTQTRVDEPLDETFGENIGILTTSAFNLDSSQSDYHSVLESLASNHTLDEIEELFDGEMSVQARAYARAIIRQNSR